jgi:hypothetical protein
MWTRNMTELGASLPHLRHQWIGDDLGMNYQFRIEPITSRPSRWNTVYAFVNPVLARVLYIGQATDLSERLRSHEKLREPASLAPPSYGSIRRGQTLLCTTRRLSGA